MKALLFTITLALCGCTQGNGLGGAPPPPDLLGPVDMVPPPDLVPPKTCGKIVGCALMCIGSGGLDAGLGNAGCVLGCGQGAPPAEVGAALSLIACAAQNCLSGGTGNQLQIFQCLLTSCPMQLAGCQGLGIGGGM
jgi:hypothetical protein